MKRKLIIVIKILAITVILYALFPPLTVWYYGIKVDLVANREATDVSSCKIIEYGYHGCGGPAWYLIYSAETTDEEELAGLVERHNEADEKFNSWLSVIYGGIAYTCELSLKPNLILENNTCVGERIFPTRRSLGNGEYEEEYERYKKLAR